jgi:5-methylcytosine-specific restriction protein A
MLSKPVKAAATKRIRGRKLQQRNALFLLENPLCTACDSEGRVSPAEEVDHRTPLWAGGSDEWHNLQGLCIDHHKAKTAREAGGRADGGWGGV